MPVRRKRGPDDPAPESPGRWLIDVITSRSVKVEELPAGTFVIAPEHVYEDFGGGRSKLRYPKGSRVPLADAERFGLVPEQKKEPAVEDKKAPAAKNKTRTTRRAPKES